MSISIVITPSGQLAIEHAPDSLPIVTAAVAAAFEQAFARSNAAGLLLLSSEEMKQELPVSLVFWRGLARQFFQAVCQLGEQGFVHWPTVAEPPAEQLAQLVADAPPMRGLEYLNIELLRSIWNELRKHVASEAANFPEGPAAYLRTVNPLWHLLGRVTFHLAENKRDPQRPFAFLATYTHRLSGQARLAHLPLADALKTYAGAKELTKLESLLEPVRRAAERSELVRELLDQKALFAPQAWTIRQAYRFLTEAPLIAEAGVVVRLPDWWSARRPPRPQVQVQIGARPASEIGLDRLLDFKIGMVLDGEPLTEDERRQLLSGTEGVDALAGQMGRGGSATVATGA